MVQTPSRFSNPTVKRSVNSTRVLFSMPASESGRWQRGTFAGHDVDFAQIEAAILAVPRKELVDP